MQTQLSADQRDALAILLLRLGLGWFLLVWAVNKILAPGQYVKIWDYFHGISIGADMPYYMGAAQIVLALAIMLGLFRTVSYALGFVAHGVTVAVVLPSLLAPFVIENGFPVNRNQSVALAALAGFAALWLLRHRDAWSLDAFLAARRRPKDGS